MEHRLEYALDEAQRVDMKTILDALAFQALPAFQRMLDWMQADRARAQERIGEAEQERDDYRDATADVLTWLRGRLEVARASHKDAKPKDKAFWASVANERRTAIRQVENIEARNSPRRIRALLEVPDD